MTDNDMNDCFAYLPQISLSFYKRRVLFSGIFFELKSDWEQDSDILSYHRLHEDAGDWKIKEESLPSD